MEQKKSQMRAGASLKRWIAVAVVLVLLGLGNVLAGVFEWHDTMAMLIFNCVCIVALVAVLVERILLMEPRKKWRLLSFLVPACGVLVLITAYAANGGEYDGFVPALACVGAMLIIYGVSCIVRWRTYSFAHKEHLRKLRDK